MVNTNDIITIVLSSSVLVGIISAWVTFVINKRNNNLKYVTEERKIWRQELRNIVDELETTRMADRKKVLQKLKVRINPYGDKDDFITRDSHIWEIIHEMEQVNSIADYNVKKEKLIMYLSLLLKYDWERTKKEVKGDSDITGLSVTLIFGMCYLIYKHFVEYRLGYNDVFLISAFVFLIIPILIGLKVFRKMIKEIWNKNFKNKIWEIFGKIGSVFLFCCFWFSCIVLIFYTLKNYNFNFINILTPKGYFDTTIVLVVMTLLHTFSNNMSVLNSTSKYIMSVERYRKEK